MVGHAAAEASLAAAYASCARMARTHYENFPVASWLLPRAMRPHVAAIYAFARTADDFADEGTRPAAERLRLLDEWLGHLEDAARGRIDESAASAPVFRALENTIRVCALPMGLFADLIGAFEQDVTTTRYPSWATVLDRLERSDFEMFDRRPAPGAADVGPMVWRALTWPRASGTR